MHSIWNAISLGNVCDQSEITNTGAYVSGAGRPYRSAVWTDTHVYTPERRDQRVMLRKKYVAWLQVAVNYTLCVKVLDTAEDGEEQSQRG